MAAVSTAGTNIVLLRRTAYEENHNMFFPLVTYNTTIPMPKGRLRRFFFAERGVKTQNRELTIFFRFVSNK